MKYLDRNYADFCISRLRHLIDRWLNDESFPHENFIEEVYVEGGWKRLLQKGGENKCQN